ncbi:thiamine phosphate synthase [Gottfriedia luciferensis]|uniref:thiamine phosphate synthase n=1 Tax=Gottfriedia luciferensis TaxID=178774 RepID=UPI001F1B0945|nr:thiamine phosphate synthase [Gottfriedia luciferensis]
MKKSVYERSCTMELIAITDDQHPIEVLASKIIQIIDVVDYVHIREKSKKAIEIITLLNILKINKVDMKKIVLNDRLDIAIFTNLSNLHLPGHGLPLVDVKEYFPNLRVGQSVHTLTDAIQAENDQADYVIYGHCFETNCKNGLPPNGIERLPEMKKNLTIPIYAIGGILPEHVQLLKENNINGIAIMSGIFSSRNPLDSALKYYERCKLTYEKEI